MIVQLNPPIWVMTPKGEGLAQLVIDYGIEHELHWTVFISDTLECWTFSNIEIRCLPNITAQRYKPTVNG